MATKKETPPEKEDVEKEAKAAKAKPDTSVKKKRSPAKKTAPKTKASKKGELNIGINVKAPEGTCSDSYCPFHGTLPVRGQILEGEIVSDKMQGTAVVKREYMRKIQKYERLEKRSSKYLVHNPPCLDAHAGDKVKIMECRPLSKLVSFVIVEKM